MPYQRTSARAWAQTSAATDRRAAVYRRPTIWVDEEGRLTARLKNQVRHCRIHLTGYKLAEKQDYLCRFIRALFLAHQRGGAVAVSRRNIDPNTDLRKQVIGAAVTAGYAKEYRSPPGSPKMSRYLPTNRLLRYMDMDPHVYDPVVVKNLVSVRDRETGAEKRYDRKHPVAADVQCRLKRVNEVNALTTITYRLWSEEEEELSNEWRQLRPVMVAVFTDDFEHHGRMYTFGHYGHQGLRSEERGTILFDGRPTVEYDYSGMHPRLLYHLSGVDYQDDPYALWDPTDKSRRLLAKVCMNAAINAPDRETAIAACNWSMRSFTDHLDSAGRRQKKEGKALRDARKLYDAHKKTGLRFNDIYDRLVEVHRPVAAHFGSDAGIRLMRVDSAIALDVMHYFATRRSAACLGCHDSFIVARSEAPVLRRVMTSCYRKHARKFYPVIR